jgi:hypothetical protein
MRLASLPRLGASASAGYISSATAATVPSNYISSASLTSTVQGLGNAGYLSTVQASFFVSTVQGLGTSSYVSSASLTSTIQGLGTAGYLSTVQASFFVSTVQGLGTATYVSSASLTSTVQGLGRAGYLSTVQASFFVSTVQGLGTATYVSSASLTSTVQGLGRAGYLSTVEASFFVSTVQGLGTSRYVSSASLTSSIQGLGSSGYLSTVQPSFFVSTVQGLGSASYISSLSLISSIQGLGTAGYVSTSRTLFSTISTYSLTSYGTTTFNATPQETIWVAGGNGASAASNIIWSSNGSNWFPATTGGFTTAVYGVAYNGSIWLASGVGGSANCNIQWSPDGMNWNPTTSGGFCNSGIGGGLAWNGSIWVAGGTGGPTLGGAGSTNSNLLWSSNGLVWNATSNAQSLNVNSVAWNGTYFLSGGADSNSGIKISGDGKTWSNTNSASNGYRGLAWNGRIWVACVINVSVIGFQFSGDGINWSNALTGGTFSNSSYSVAWNGYMFVGGGQTTTFSNTIQWSMDGMNWNGATTGGFNTGLLGIAWNGSFWVAVGNGGSAASNQQYSYDGKNWLPGAGTTSNAGRCVAYSVTNTPDIATSNLNFYLQGQPTYLTSTHQVFTTTDNLILDSVVYINNASNAVGINTANPLYQLDVNGSANISGNLLIGSNIGLGGCNTPQYPLDIAGTNAAHFGINSNAGIWIHTTSNGYTSIKQSGGNSVGGMYADFQALGDGLHWGYNALYSNGAVVLPGVGAGSSRITTTYGAIGLYTGKAGSAPSTLAMYIANAGDLPYNYIGLGKTNPATQLDLSTDGARKLTTTAWTTGSDMRIKKNIVDANLQRCLELVSSINLKYFEWDEVAMSTIVDDKRSLGFIAQDIEEVFPNAVFCTSTFGYDDFKNLNVDQIFKAHFGATKQMLTVSDNQQSTIQGQQTETQVLLSTTQGQSIQILTLQTSYDTLLSQVSTLIGKST